MFRERSALSVQSGVDFSLRFNLSVVAYMLIYRAVSFDITLARFLNPNRLDGIYRLFESQNLIIHVS